MEEDTNHYKDTMKSKTNENIFNLEIDTKKIAQELHLALAAGKSTIKVRFNWIFDLGL